ncbi:MAG: hypothetical protein GX970_14890 [Phyllobacteriaceae bacterium]|nr:hypothetical protein [Phyllobacteriaceae bacterium]
MADAPGKDKSTDPKAPGKSGAVKPPVLEGTARPAASEKPEASQPKTEAKASAVPPKPEPAKPMPGPTPSVTKKPEPSGRGISALAAGLLGGVIGLGASYGLASLGYWPMQAPAPQPADPRIAQFAGTVPELQTVTNTIQDELATLNGRVSAIETGLENAPASAVAEADPALASEIEALRQQVEELAARPAETVTQPDPAASEAIATLEAQLAELRTKAEADAARLAETEARLSTLATTTSDAAAATDSAAQLPLIFSGLDSAFANGRGFEPELNALRGALPEASVPEALAGRATGGLPRPEAVRQALTQIIPDMLAQRPINAEGDWQEATLDWFRGAVAMRPNGDVEGDSPDARVARLEAAVGRGDFQSAAEELDALPDAMRAPAGSIEADIKALAEAQAFIDALRAQALQSGASR